MQPPQPARPMEAPTISNIGGRQPVQPARPETLFQRGNGVASTRDIRNNLGDVFSGGSYYRGNITDKDRREALGRITKEVVGEDPMIRKGDLERRIREAEMKSGGRNLYDREALTTLKNDLKTKGIL